MMKHFFLMLFASTTFVLVNGQDFSGLSEIELKHDAQYMDAKDQVLDCCYYLIGTPYEKKDDNRVSATLFVDRWVTGAPNCKFKLDDSLLALTGGKEDLLEVYKTCFAMAVAESQAPESEMETIKYRTVELLLEYCGNSVNGIKLSKELKKAFQAMQDGDLEAWLGV